MRLAKVILASAAKAALLSLSDLSTEEIAAALSYSNVFLVGVTAISILGDGMSKGSSSEKTFYRSGSLSFSLIDSIYFIPFFARYLLGLYPPTN